MTDAVLRVRDLTIAYSTKERRILAVRGVGFDLRRGETLALVGESGSGKTTVAFGVVRFLGRAGTIVSGSIEFLGQELVGLGERQLRRMRGKNMFLISQDPLSALNPALKIGRQLSEILTEHNDIPDSEAFQQCVAMLEQVHLAEPRRIMDRYPHQLSGGQLQRVIIAGALLNRPALLIMDEPTTALDVTIEAAVLDLVREIKQKFDTAVLFISHDLGVVAQVADRVAVMYGGEIVEEGPTDELLLEPRHPYTRALLDCIPRLGMSKAETLLGSIPGSLSPVLDQSGGCAFAPRCLFAEDRCRAEHPTLDVVVEGHAVRCVRADEIPARTLLPSLRRQPVVPADVNSASLLETRGLVVRYEQSVRPRVSGLFGRAGTTQVKAVEGVSFSVGPGETLGIVGESGSGKTSVAKALLGLVPTASGSMEFLGMELEGALDSRARSTLKLIQMVFQNPDSTLNPSMRAGPAVARAVAKLSGLPRREVRRRAIELLEAVKLGPDYYQRLPAQLSGGEKQRVAIARALAGNPSLIVADEPTSALDVAVQATVLNLLQEIQSRNRTSLILISHDLSVVLYLADAIGVMYLGHVVEYGPRAAFLSPPHHPYTEALLSAIPVADSRIEVAAKIRLGGTVPSPVDPPSGCVFHTRCPRYIGEVCHTRPPERALSDGHRILCHHEPAYLAEVQLPPGAGGAPAPPPRGRPAAGELPPRSSVSDPGSTDLGSVPAHGI